jgi:predicted nucleic acid-binding protein
VAILIDTTVLSNLASVSRLDLLGLLPEPLYVASAVYEEIQQGIQEGYEALEKVDRVLDAGLLSLITVDDELTWRTYREMPDKLHRGEAMSLAIARQRGWRFLTDDRAARIHAERLGVSFSGTVGVLVYAVQTKHLTLTEGNQTLADIVARAKYYSPVQDLRELL